MENVSLYEIPAVFLYLFTRRPEMRHDFGFRTRCFCWVGEIMVEPLRLGWKKWATFSRIVAYGDDVIEIDAYVFIHVVGGVPRNVNAIFLHDGDGSRIDAMGLHPGAVNIRFAISKMPEVTFCYLAPAAIAGAEHQNLVLLFHIKRLTK